jgi:hypothetical protein
MHNELRCQAKTHAKSEKLSKERNKVPHLLPNFYFLFLLKNNKQKNNKDMLMEKEMTSNPSM